MASLSELTTMTDPEIKRWLKKAEKLGTGTLVMALLGADELTLQSVVRNVPKKERSRLVEIVEKFRNVGGMREEVENETRKLEALFP